MNYPAPPNEPIALVGSSCRFAGGANSPSKLWELLSNPTDLSKRVPSSRFSAKGFFHQDPEYHGTTNSPYGYWLEQDHRVFDASFFNITPKEAEAIDPQQRLLLEVVYEALESAGYTMSKYAGQNVGVYAGVMTADYQTISERDELNASQYSSTGNSRAIISNRLSYFFNFHGPSMTIDTACSASLVALHQAVLSLRAQEIDMACVAGANLMLTPEQFLAESDLHMLSPSGHSRMWDSKADGYARGEGIAALFIKTLSRALADGDNIQAIIRETGVNSDGRTKGITVPNPEAQRDLIQRTYMKSNLDPFNPEHKPQYFEAHGTGTPVGDPREARAIAEAFFSDTDAADPALGQQQLPKLLVGSVKTIIGHTEGAAGLAGVLKVVQSMNNHAVPPNLHLNTLNPNVLPFYKNLKIPMEKTCWPQPPPGQPYRASVNSFGFGGTNAHAIIERYEAPIHDMLVPLFNQKLSHSNMSLAKIASGMSKPGSASVSSIVVPLLFSAASEKSLVVTVRKYLAYISSNPQVTTQQLAWHLYNHRNPHILRVCLVPVPGRPATQPLESWIEKAEQTSLLDAGLITRPKQLQHGLRILGIFTGQGAQYATMSKGLFQTSSVYRAAIEALDAVLKGCDDPPTWSLQQQILANEQDSRVGVAEVSQPLCTALQIALIDLLTSIDISFHCVVGHSSGEIAAAYAAGRLTRRDAILISYYRGRYAHLAAGTNGSKGAMMACGLSKDEADDFCSEAEYKGKICVAASNSPTLVTLSGDMDAVTAAFNDLRSRGKFAKQLNIDTAYHSFHMLHPVEAYSKALEKCDITSPAVATRIRWISSVYAKEAMASEELALGYWGENMINPVLFQEAITLALEQCGPFDCAIEVGPHPAMNSATTEIMKNILKTPLPYHGLLQRGKEGGMAFAEFLGSMWANFGPSSVSIRSFIENSSQAELIKSRLNDTPSYAWDHSQIYLRESRIASQYHSRQQPPHELLGVRTRDDNQFELRWRNILKLDKLPWVEGHKFQGQALLPASAYCVMALDAAKSILNARTASIVELQDLEFLSGITIEPDSLGVETLFTLSVVSPRNTADDDGKDISADFTLTSVPVTSFNFAPMRKNFQGKMRITLEDPALDALPRRSEDPRAETLPVNIDSFYQMMDGIGLSYTGPFKALTAIDRRFNYARATLSLKHELDTTQLDVSPATLDTCFQSTFATFSSPGDRALWTSFLPTNIEKMQFNLAKCDRQFSPGEITVESHLTKFVPFYRGSAATITADLCIFDDRGQSMFQVECLTVSSFASTRPENDHELYLHTVMDLDPEYEFVPAPIGYETPSPSLIESSERVAQFFMKKPNTSSGLVDTPPLSPTEPNTPDPIFLGDVKSQSTSAITEQQLQQFILESPYSQFLELIWESGKYNPQDLPETLPSFIQEAQLLHSFQQHLGRLIQQIAHRYPMMNVLDLTFSEWAFTENVLDGLQDAFTTYRVPGDPLPRNMLYRRPSLRDNKKVSFADLDLDAEPADKAALPGTYDLVVLSTSAFSRFSSSHVSIIQKIRPLMRNGGFLVIVHAEVSAFTTNFSESHSSRQPSGSDITVSMTPNWSDLLDQSGFLPPAIHSQQKHSRGLSLVIRQANGVKEIHPTNFGLADTVQDEYVLVVGQNKTGGEITQEQLSKIYPGRTMTVWSVEKVEDITQEAASACTSVLFLADLSRPVCTSMTDNALAMLKSLMQPGKAILWVTTNARYDPERAASLGLTRTLKAEIPNLIVQVLDLDKPQISTTLIVSQFVQLLVYREYLGLSDDAKGKNPISFEPEIHMEKGKRLIPRVLPYRPAINRLNAYRRDVTETYNTLESCVLMDNVRAADGRAQFEAHIVHDAGKHFGEQSDSILIHVEYSSLWPLSISPSQKQYFCIGKDVETDRWVAGISANLGSTVPISKARDLSSYNLDHRSLAALLSPMMLALAMADWAGNADIVLIEPDPTFLLCLRCGFPPVLAKNGWRLHVWTSSSKLASEDHGVKYIHPRSSIRELKQALPRSHPTVLDFLPRGNPMSQTLEGLAAGCFDYSRWPCSLPRFEPRLTEEAQECVSQWIPACNMSIHLSTLQSFQELSSKFTTPAQLLSANEPIAPFTVIEWKADRLVSLPVKPIVEPRLLRPNLTYVLVGLTRDLGQSLCRLFIQHGARNIIVVSRNPDESPAWVSELSSEGAKLRVERLDVTNLEDVEAFKERLTQRKDMPPVGGVVNGAMVLEDRVFAKMDIDTWKKVMRPKTVGSKNLDIVFDGKLDFFIMTSSFAAIGGHAGQSNYAAANMYMNGLAANRRRRGVAGSVLNIGVIYGLGLLAREKQGIYTGLEKEGYPPISERDIHHMFLEAIVAGRPVPGQIVDLTTGLARYRVNDPNPLHWHHDRRFCHYTVDNDVDDSGPQRDSGGKQIIVELISHANSVQEVSNIVLEHFRRYLEAAHQLPGVTGENSIAELGLDSLAAVEIRNWFYKSVGRDVAVMKIVGSTSIFGLCDEIALKVMEDRN
ncbi:Nonribosomal peptide synthetase 14 [Cytospora mali]|uniref:Nonribosomal peptide synthetase 14 n=1 Tax=Cytospora mali TaxID=578113 RepID=A0A194VSD3_CYTMA|nr:Nonribosomal peptide synthetase 14 [Valsa mali]